MGPLLLFDGVCALCNASVAFVLKRDRSERFRFAALQSSLGHRILLSHGMDPDELDTVVLVHRGRAYTRSSAALRVAGLLPFPWPLLTALLVVPRLLRDWVYGFIARRRYAWFGRHDACMLPPPGSEHRFLDDAEPDLASVAALGENP